MIIYDKEKKSYYLECPHDDCKSLIIVEEKDINCKIFRHGVYKKDLKGIPPHTKMEECIRLKKEDLIYGCGRPFLFDGKKVEICDYI